MRSLFRLLAIAALMSVSLITVSFAGNAKTTKVSQRCIALRFKSIKMIRQS
jgi:hypothetical protein